MKGRGKVKGILIEGNDGHEYLLGFGVPPDPDVADFVLLSRSAAGEFGGRPEP